MQKNIFIEYLALMICTNIHSFSMLWSTNPFLSFSYCLILKQITSQKMISMNLKTELMESIRGFGFIILLFESNL